MHDEQLEEDLELEIDNQQVSLLPPPDTEYTTMDTAIKETKNFAIQHGYVLSVTGGENEQKKILQCRHAPHRKSMQRSETAEQQQRKSMSGTCPFKVYVRKTKEGTFRTHWNGQHHDHPKPTTMAMYHQCRSLDEDQDILATKLLSEGAVVKEVVTIINKGREVPIAPKDMSNRRQALEKARNAGRPPIQVLLDNLEQEHWIYVVEYEPNGPLTHLFLAHPDSITRFQFAPTVVFLDATYKTNKYGMPLLHFCSRTATEDCYTVAFAFLRGEAESDISWALSQFQERIGFRNTFCILTDRALAQINAIHNVVPEMKIVLCRFHLLAAVKAHFSQLVDLETLDDFMTEFSNTIDQPSKTRFEAAFSELESKYKSIPQGFEYLRKTWLPFSIHFCKFAIDTFTHLGQYTTSPAEGLHRVLKAYILSSKSKIPSTQRCISNYVVNQENELKRKIETEIFGQPGYLRDVPILKKLLGKVSVACLRYLYTNLKAIKAHPEDHCDCKIHTTHQLPCRCVLSKTLRKGQKLTLLHIGRCWWLQAFDIDVDSESSSDAAGMLEPLTQKELYKEKKIKGGSTKAQVPRAIRIAKKLEKKQKPFPKIDNTTNKRNIPHRQIRPHSVPTAMTQMDREESDTNSFLPMSLLMPFDKKAKQRMDALDNID
ncbi:putative MULE transposase domain protein [Blattamonas nauphoetae]|uniref:MULE transposase domain protein n=1 Tax=Blattamonas nauphoetae TaxID=2049346 RepID=A0ABQ9YBU2_9EUKA|nr:putative MULE transposase domain protein [Blattamonas nauphoetae]